MNDDEGSTPQGGIGGNGTGGSDDNDDDDNIEYPLYLRHLREIGVEPVSRLRVWEANQIDWADDAGCCEEWQIVGSDEAGNEEEEEEEEDGGSQNDDNNGGERPSRPGDALRAVLIAEPTADDDDDAKTRRRFITFLCNPNVETRVLWLNQTLFLMCEGPDSYTEGDENTLPWYLTNANHHGYFRFSVKIADGKAYTFIFTSSDFDVDDDDGWTSDLLRLFAQSATVKGLEFRLVSQGLLEAVVSRVPPPCGRTVNCRTIFMDEGSARTLAFHTHRDTELVIHVGDWFDQVSSSSVGTYVPILADSIRTSQCPKRLVLDDTGVSSDRLDDAAALVDALRTTTGVEAITIRLSCGWENYWGGSDLLLESIGRNNGIRKLVVEQRLRKMKARRMMEIWNRILVSRTIESVDATRVDAATDYTEGDRRECAMHVVSLLRSNRVVTQLLYDPGTHDATIMERHVGPLLELNRFRPTVESWTASAGGNKTVALLVGSDRVRTSPWLLYYVVKTRREVFAKSSSSSSSLSRKRPPVS